MKILVGLGNPGAKHIRNRHNIGFMALERVQEHYATGPWRKRFRGECSEGVIDGTRVLLLKPATYMNESGRSVGEAARFLKVATTDIVVIHDELDLAPGKLKVKTGGGTAGHNGLKSIAAHLNDQFVRVRLGIGHPGRKDLVAGYVLRDFAKADNDWLNPLLDAIAAEAGWLLKDDAGRFQGEVARRLAGDATASISAPPAPPGSAARSPRRQNTPNPSATGGAAKRPSQRDLARGAVGSSGRSTGAAHPAGERMAKRAQANETKTALADKLSKLWRRGPAGNDPGGNDPGGSNT